VPGGRRQAADGAPPPTAARLLRFACALHLAERHRRALAHSAVMRNMEAGNFGCGARRLRRRGRCEALSVFSSWRRAVCRQRARTLVHQYGIIIIWLY